MSETIRRPKLGEWRIITNVAYRRVEHRENYGRRIKVWRSLNFTMKPFSAMYIGYRTVADGETQWEDEVGYIFIPHSHREIWLFVQKPREKPVYVFPEDTRLEEIAPASADAVRGSEETG